MPMLTSSSFISVSLLPILKSACLQKEQHELVKSRVANFRGQWQLFNVKKGHLGITAAGPVGLGVGLKPIDKSISKWSSSTVCSAASNTRCGDGQTETLTLEAPKITQAPTHILEKSPQLDDGSTGFPPQDNGDGGGGGGRGGGNWSGKFLFFAFLMFLAFLKDKECEGDYKSSRRR